MLKPARSLAVHLPTLLKVRILRIIFESSYTNSHAPNIHKKEANFEDPLSASKLSTSGISLVRPVLWLQQLTPLVDTIKISISIIISMFILMRPLPKLDPRSFLPWGYLDIARSGSSCWCSSTASTLEVVQTLGSSNVESTQPDTSAIAEHIESFKLGLTLSDK